MAQTHYDPKFYSIPEAYLALYKGIKTSLSTITFKKSTDTLSDEFKERIMLAVTEVNSCEICSYVHTRIALEKGLDEEEVQMILGGNSENIPEQERVAILFAQHYADTRGKPTRQAWNTLVETYGEQKSRYILGAIRTMMIGNIFGVPVSALKNRLKGKPNKKSNIGYELSMMVLPIVFAPIAFVHALISQALRIPLLSFRN